MAGTDCWIWTFEYWLGRVIFIINELYLWRSRYRAGSWPSWLEVPGGWGRRVSPSQLSPSLVGSRRRPGATSAPCAGAGC